MTTETYLRTAANPVRADNFRKIIRNRPTGVVAICAADPETAGPAGLIVGTFQPLSSATDPSRGSQIAP